MLIVRPLLHWQTMEATSQELKLGTRLSLDGCQTDQINYIISFREKRHLEAPVPPISQVCSQQITLL